MHLTGGIASSNHPPTLQGGTKARCSIFVCRTVKTIKSETMATQAIQARQVPLWDQESLVVALASSRIGTQTNLSSF
jgi:hypothetical protein